MRVPRATASSATRWKLSAWSASRRRTAGCSRISLRSSAPTTGSPGSRAALTRRSPRVRRARDAAAAILARELADEPVAVAAVERLDELDDRVRVGVARALEEKGGRVERHVELVGLLLVRDRRLDRLDAVGDRDAVALLEQLVERRLIEVLRRQPGDQRLADVQRLDRHRRVVGEPQALRDDDPLGGRHLEAAAEPGACGRHRQRERPRARAHASPPHLLAERGHRQLLRDLRLAHERAAAAPAHQVALADEIVERGPHGQARDAQIDAQLALGGNRRADAELLDQVAYAVAGLTLLGGHATAILASSATSGQYHSLVHRAKAV